MAESRKNKESLTEELTQYIEFLDGLITTINNSQTSIAESLTKRIMQIQHRRASVRRNVKNDRVVPLETIRKSEFEMKNDGFLDNPKIIYGQNSDEMLRSNGLIAMALANKVYIRSENYRPETEEGRSILAHELTHVQQYSEKRIEKRTSKEALEYEAEVNENNEKYNPDKYITKTINGKEYHLTPKQWKTITDDVIRDIEKWVEMQENQMPEEEYFQLLLKLEEFENNYEKTGELIWE